VNPPAPARRETVLIIEDDPAILFGLRDNFERAGYAVRTAIEGQLGLDLARSLRPDLLLLDLMLPGRSGYEICQTLRAEDHDMPIIMLTALGQEDQIVKGLNLGADDYVTKPFSPAELVARVKAVLRRSEGVAATASLVQIGGVTVDLGRHEVRVQGAPVEFTAKEFELLRFLAERPGLALSRQQILDGVWGYDWFGDARTVDVHIAQVRKKTGDALTIATVRGLGYRLERSGST
jgi:DNA-binding response OmpR family regulator